jgi:hypothetical protein
LFNTFFVFKKYRTPLRIHDPFHLIGYQIKQDIKIHLGCDDLADMKEFDMAMDLFPELPIFTSSNCQAYQSKRSSLAEAS